MLTGTAVVATVRGKAEQSEILQIPAPRLRRALGEIPSVSETIVRALIMRRKRASGNSAT
jgi:thioredoxin reductase (NADPH)